MPQVEQLRRVLLLWHRRSRSQHIGRDSPRMWQPGDMGEEQTDGKSSVLHRLSVVVPSFAWGPHHFSVEPMSTGTLSTWFSKGD